MNSAASCQSPLEWDTLLAYWMGEQDSDSEAQIEQHYLGCTSCSERLALLIALIKDVQHLIKVSGVNMVVTDQFVQKLKKNGMHVREYHIPANGSVNCTVTPEDEFVLGRLQASLDRVERLDMVYIDDEGNSATRLNDIPFDMESGSVVFSTRIDTLRALPATRIQIRLLAVDSAGEHQLGNYTFNHRPYVR
ncbi:hypothetical protein [Sedimenticola sp.]|uniref:hypothetical protein n=1 Tax=Sedimenticola sp. TaxID=1940285 RepID=UPI003D105F48